MHRRSSTAAAVALALAAAALAVWSAGEGRRGEGATPGARAERESPSDVRSTAGLEGSPVVGDRVEVPPFERDVEPPAGARGMDTAAASRAASPEQGAVEGRVLLDEGVAPQVLVVRVRRYEPGVDADRGRILTTIALQHPEGRFHVDSLEPGYVRVELAPCFGRRALASVEPVELVAGEVTCDPRLDPLDLRGRVFAFRLDVVDGSGAAVSDVFARQVEGGRRWWRDRAPLDVATDRSVVDLEVGAKGFVTRRIDGVSGDRRVVLERELEVQLLFPSLYGVGVRDLRFEEGEIELDVVRARIHSDPDGHHVLDSAIDGIWEEGLDLRVPKAGVYYLSLDVGLYDWVASLLEPVVGPSTSDRRRVVVEDSPETQVVIVEPLRAELEAAVERLAPRLQRKLQRVR